MSSGDIILVKAIQDVVKKDQGERTSDDESPEEEHFSKLSDFSTDYVLESVARLVNLISADQDGEPLFKRVKPPPSMSARYNMGAKLAEAIVNLGYRGGEEIGYQTFLYGTEKDLRNIFIFLLDKLPKEKGIQVDQVSDPMELLKRRIKSKLVSQLDLPWAPAECFPSGLRPLKGGSFSRQGVRGCQDFCACDLCFADHKPANVSNVPKETRGAFYNQRCSALDTPSKLCSSLISYNEALKISASGGRLDIPSAHDEKVLLENIFEHEVKDFKANDLEHQIGSMRGSELIERVGTDTTLSESPKSGMNSVEELKSKKLALEDKTGELQVRYKSVRDETIKIRKEVAQQKLRKVDLEQQALELKASKQKRDQILTLLPEAEENLEKLMRIVQKSKEKLKSWKVQFREHEKDLEDQHSELLKRLSEQQNIQEHGSGPNLKSKVSELENEISEKEILIKKYSAQLKKAKPSDQRSTYTGQILEILNQISRQRQETSKLLEDVRGTQKDINLLDGKLYRTYLEAENKVFQMAKEDGNLIHVYRSLTDIHKESSVVVEIIRQTGQTKRANRAVQDQISLEQTKNNRDRIIELKRDLEKIRAENKGLKEKLNRTKSNIKT